ncbi:MAG: hypothetical protein COA91_09620 [Robiginitomaculum sp.]|nr:MAG: hypothetical protein COA91_09620 [Robiginitomaculum sp.]
MKFRDPKKYFLPFVIFLLKCSLVLLLGIVVIEILGAIFGSKITILDNIIKVVVFFSTGVGISAGAYLVFSFLPDDSFDK